MENSKLFLDNSFLFNDFLMKPTFYILTVAELMKETQQVNTSPLYNRFTSYENNYCSFLLNQSLFSLK